MCKFKVGVKMIFEKIRERLELYRFDIQKVVSKVLGKYGFPYESVVQDEIHYELDNFFENKDTINIINQVEAEYNNGWIPCEVELPKIATSYLVAEEVIVNSKKLYVVDIRLFGTEDEWLCPSNRKIIAWQPLPRPPKGE